MSRNHAWARAYLEQAKVDLAAARSLSGLSAGSESMFLVALQMALEKAMKAALLWSDPTASPEYLASSHQAFERLHASVRLNPKQPLQSVVIAPAAGNPKLRHNLFRWFRELESLSPGVVARNARRGNLNRLAIPSLEYPWENPDRRRCCWPARDLEFMTRISKPASGRIKVHALAYLDGFMRELENRLPAEAEWA